MRCLRVLIPLSFAFLLFAIGLSPSHAAERVTCYTTWDDAYLYMAFEVQDRDVESRNTSHMSNPWEDDAVEVFIETDNQKAPNRTPSTFQMSVSAGGGSSWLIGQDGVPTPKKIFIFKYAKKLQGTLNRPLDRDIGYVIELAMPWKEMGGPPQAGRVMGFNVVCRMQGETTGFVSFSPEVKTEDDIQSPARWGNIKFTDTPTVVAMQDGAVVCRKALTRSPVVDGNLSPGEWNRDMTFQIVKPEAPLVQPKQRYLLERLTLTHYFYWYQGDERKEAPFAHVRYEDGSSALTDQPLRGAGPWFSHDRVQWHKDELTDIRRAGIDVIMPVYWGCAGEKQGFANKGLNCLVQALKELKAEKKDYPLVGMFFDTSAMWADFGNKPDLKGPAVQKVFYGMIKDFFVHVPDEFRAEVQLPPDKGGAPAYIIALYSAGWFSDFDGSFVEYCNRRFAEDFDGRKLVWIGSSDYRPKAEVMDGYCSYGAGSGLQYDDTGWIDVAGVGAGYDDSAVRGRATPIRSRMDGDTYRKDWDALVLKSPDWVIVDGWNEFHEGSDVCASRQYGVRYVGLTKINALRFNGMREYDAKFMKHNTPSVMLPGGLYQVSLTIRNAGTKPWYAGQGFFLACRWFKDGQLFADNGARLPLQAALLAGQTMEKTMGIRVTDQEGKPLPEGEYELRWEMVGYRDTWFSAGGDTPLCVPVRVGKPAAPGFSIAGSTLPTLMKAGGAYTVMLKVRNDGLGPWKAGRARIGYRWCRSSVDLNSASQDSLQVVASNESASVLQADVEPGRVAEITVPVRAAAADGSPLPTWTLKDLWTYVLKWDVFDGEKWLGSHAVGSASESVAVTSTDYGARFVESTTPKELAAGRRTGVSVTIENRGTETWTPAEYAIGYHWYYLDGTEALWAGEKSALPSAVAPGEKVTVKAYVTPPAFDGQYYLVWDLAHGDTWCSTTANTRGGDTLVALVKVTNGKLVSVDLSRSFDADVISFDTDWKDGDMDGKGATFPGEFIPPETTMTRPDGLLWPCGYWTSEHGKGLESSRRISFAYPPKADGVKNAVTCKGQTVGVRAGRYKAVHVLAAASADTSGEFVLAVGGQNARRRVEFTSWNEAPRHGEHPGFVCLHRHTPAGDGRGQACYLNHYVIPADPRGELKSIRLPSSDTIKILAITLEKAE